MSLYGYKPIGKKALWTTMKHATRPRQRSNPKPKQAKPRKPIRHASTGRAKDYKAYKRLREAWLVGKECEACHLMIGRPDPHPATEVHHRNGRSGKLLLQQDKWIACCRQGHRAIHDQPNHARYLGLLAPKGVWNKP